MIYMHEDKDTFKKFISEISNFTGIHESIVEKDYYVTLMLNRLSETEPNAIFKGGTSLSKCYGIINRFSEDIDLNYLNGDKTASESMRQRFSREIRQCADELGFEPVNFSKEHPLRSKDRFVRYVYDYQPIFQSGGVIKSDIEIETGMFATSLPVERRPIGSIAENYFRSIGNEKYLAQHGLSGCTILTQSVDRTYIDKLFAVADYYLDDNIAKHSRHMYDLYMISRQKDISRMPQDFISGIRKERAEHTRSKTSQPDCDLSEVLQEVLDKDVYKDDYESVTRQMIYDDVSYEDAKRSLQDTIETIKDMPCFQRQDKVKEEKFHSGFIDFQKDLDNRTKFNKTHQKTQKDNIQQKSKSSHKIKDEPVDPSDT